MQKARVGRQKKRVPASHAQSRIDPFSPLREADVELIVEDLKLHLQTSPQSLTEDINELVQMCNFARRAPLDEALQALERVLRRAKNLQQALEHLPDDLTPPGSNLIERLRETLHADVLMKRIPDIILAKLNVSRPPFANELDRLIKRCQELKDRWDKFAKFKAGRRGPASHRHVFAQGLGRVFTHHFGLKPTTYRDGAWCGFLARAFSLAEGQQLDRAGAFDLWRKARG